MSACRPREVAGDGSLSGPEGLALARRMFLSFVGREPRLLKRRQADLGTTTWYGWPTTTADILQAADVSEKVGVSLAYGWLRQAFVAALLSTGHSACVTECLVAQNYHALDSTESNYCA
ncbi:hypothetical protein JCM4914_74380 [Streptomyces platensis subsp. malvinus]